MNKYLSKTFILWYQRLFDTLGQEFIPENPTHPHLIIGNCQTKHLKQSLVNIQYVQGKIPENLNNNSLVSNSEKLISYINSNKEAQENIGLFFDSLPLVTNNRNYSGCTDTKPRLLILDPQHAFVVIKVKDIAEYLRNYYLLKPIFKEDIKVTEEIGVLTFENVSYFISNYGGFDYETLLLDFNRIDLEEKLRNCFQQIEFVSRKNGIFLRNNAPRNLITENTLANYLIDFDHVYDLENSNNLQIYMKSLEKKAWYADIFDIDIIENILGKQSLPNKKNIKISAGCFEKLFYNTQDSKLSLEAYEYTFNLTYKLEKKDKVGTTLVYGHELGRFISDYWCLKSEVDLLRVVERISEVELKILRHNLFILSRVDQELAFRKSYCIDSDKVFLSENYFQEVYNKKGDISLFNINQNEIDGSLDFYSFYEKCLTEIKKFANYKLLTSGNTAGLN